MTWPDHLPAPTPTSGGTKRPRPSGSRAASQVLNGFRFARVLKGLKVVSFPVFRVPFEPSQGLRPEPRVASPLRYLPSGRERRPPDMTYLRVGGARPPRPRPG